MKNLAGNSYPGRGIILGRSDVGQLIQVYWVMGRSPNSRNRILVLEKNIIKTTPFGPTKVEDPSLIIYNAMKKFGDYHVVSNGTQTDTVKKDIVLSLGKTFHEPDDPNFTPRITGLTNQKTGEMVLSKISQNPADHKKSIRSYYFYQNIKPGFGFCLHTYSGDGNPLPTFDKDPYLVSLTGNINKIAKTYWKLLNKENRVALVVKGIGKGKKDSFVIINALS